MQKDQGCMHMACPSCKYEFCWMCLGDWKSHSEKTGGFFKCNIYVPDPEDQLKKEQRRARL